MKNVITYGKRAEKCECLSVRVLDLGVPDDFGRPAAVFAFSFGGMGFIVFSFLSEQFASRVWRWSQAVP